MSEECSHKKDRMKSKFGRILHLQSWLNSEGKASHKDSKGKSVNFSLTKFGNKWSTS